MVPLKIVRHTLKFYLVLGVLFLFLTILGTTMILTSTEAISRAEVRSNEYFILAMGSFLLFLALFTVIRYFKNVPVITVDDITIIFGNKKAYPLNDIKDIQLTGKVPFPFIFDFPIEGAALHFKDGTTKLLYDDLYANAWQVKSFLDQVVVKKKPYSLLSLVRGRPTRRSPLHLSRLLSCGFWACRSQCIISGLRMNIS